MGLVNNSFLIAVQSTVEASDRGVATSSVVFMRMVGQSLGTAVFGGIVNAALAGRIAGAGDIVDRMLIPSFRDALAPAERAALMQALGASLHNVFLIDLVLAAALAGLAALLPRGLSPLTPRRLASRRPRRRRQRSTHSLVSFSCTAFWPRRSCSTRKSTRSSSWSWLKQEKTTRLHAGRGIAVHLQALRADLLHHALHRRVDRARWRGGRA